MLKFVMQLTWLQVHVHAQITSYARNRLLWDDLKTQEIPSMSHEML